MKFSIRDLLLVTVIVALACGWSVSAGLVGGDLQFSEQFSGGRFVNRQVAAAAVGSKGDSSANIAFVKDQANMVGVDKNERLAIALLYGNEHTKAFQKNEVRDGERSCSKCTS